MLTQKCLEFVVQHKEAENYHKQFEKNTLSTNSKFLFKRAQMLYLTAGREISNELTNHFIKYDPYGITIGIILTTIVCISICLFNYFIAVAINIILFFIF